MFEAVESYRHHIIATLGGAGTQGLTVKELRARLEAGEGVIRRTLTLLLCTGVVREAFRYTPGARGAVPRAYTLVPTGDSMLPASPTATSERVVTE
ncbi:hypothetical protein [Corallococcus exiguus]|uniref:Uncharacterized protein n=1 Tax=Corallococcus exiguus TaxID=83462 RepID=A0A7X5BX25_9BACT|nr:hypothetical protein [Corallococcus exiguus]NBC44788.1 hypothetical protein [Corallococcus exiguus]TNV61422.1 hypothetical protein FH620_21135 [Corallococcus exiguus]